LPPAPSADYDSSRLLAPGSFDDRLRRIAPSNLDFDIGCPDPSCSLLGLHENLVRDGIKHSAEISFGAGKLQHLNGPTPLGYALRSIPQLARLAICYGY
jgi:hypothetical protein